MTNIISAPPELVEQWVDLLESHSDQAVFTLAAHWGYTQAVKELEEFLKKTVDTPCSNSMTDQQHPITPPPALAAQWVAEISGDPVASLHPITRRLVERAAQWGADMELEACCQWISDDAEALRIYRRPKPPSLKEQALEALNQALEHNTLDVQYDTIRQALEQLDD